MREVVVLHRPDVFVVWPPALDLVVAAVQLLSTYPQVSLVLLAGDGDVLIEARVRPDTYSSWTTGLIDAVRAAAGHAQDP